MMGKYRRLIEFSLMGAALGVALFGGDLAALAQTAPAAPAAPTPKLDSGNTAWMIVATALVLMMTIPGLALFYGGMVRKMNILATMMQSFAICCLVSIIWMVVGYSLAFAGTGPWIGDLSKIFLKGIDLNSFYDPAAHTIPEVVFLTFQMTFAIITPALITGAFADRMKFSAMLWFIGIWSILVYSPIAHMVWAPDGWMFKLGVLDFAGGTVVHINAGIAGLVAAIVLGKRMGYGKVSFAPHNLVYTLIGASLLWVGWFGFNAGSALTADGRAGMAMLVTQIATAAAALAWMFSEWVVNGKPSVLGIASGAVAGLVAITPAAGFVLPGGSLIIGIVAGIGCFIGATWLKRVAGYDDSLDAFGVHGIGGIIGAILTGVFAVSSLSAVTAADGTVTPGAAGLFDGGGFGQVWLQIIGVAATVVYSGIATFIILKVIDMVMGLRVDEATERDGLDLSLHGETIQ
jgi:Amt family ammonium transporter